MTGFKRLMRVALGCITAEEVISIGSNAYFS